MTADRWHEVSRIYHAARQYEGHDRDAFVRDACAGDEALQREVESLLAYGPVAQSMMERPAAALAAQILDTSILDRAGQHFGPYTIESLLDSGGMGEVYRARDTKLGRDVAMKILPAEFTADLDGRARFEREARLLATLNHPHIAQIYGMEESGGVQAIVMELVPGGTLAAIIQAHGKSRRGLPLDRALDLARQIADALQAAHEKGIIHRDLKPANIKVTPEGSIKVLDFGLAKPIVLDAASSDQYDPTLARTREGVIVGTPAYMSPEQACGGLVDKRTDIWAFGCVLYEMLTGRRAFDGENLAATLAAIVRGEPDWTALPRDTPAPVRRVLRHCLEKDRKRRIADASDVRLEIEDAQAQKADAPPVPAPPRSMLAAWSIAGAAVLAASVLALPAINHLREVPPVTPSETRLDITTPPTTDPLSFALSPDGKQIVYVASAAGATRLWLRSLSLDSTTATQLVGSDGATLPFWSPDGRSVGFFAGSELKSLDLDTGQPHGLAPAPVGLGGTWNADGVILFVPTTNRPVFRVAASGAPVAVTTLSGALSHHFPHFLRDGRRFLYHANGNATTGGIYLGSLDTPSGKRLTPSDTAGAYLAPTPEQTREPGWLIWIQGGALRAQRLDLEREELTGDRVTLADPVAYDPNFAGGFSVSAAGMLAYRRGDDLERRQLTWVNRSGKPLGVLLGPDTNRMTNPRISPDGRQVAVQRTVEGNTDIYMVDPIRGFTRFTFDPASDRFPIWSADGRRLAFSRTTSPGRYSVYVKPASMARPEERLSESAQFPTDWSRDDRFLLYFAVDLNDVSSPNGISDIWVLPLTGDRRPWAFLTTPRAEGWATFSPDGRWVAYMSNDSGRYEIYVRPMPEQSGAQSTAQRQVSRAGGVFPTWSNDGNEIYYVAPDGRMMAVSFTEKTTFPLGTPVALFPTNIVGSGQDRALGRQYDVARDGRFLINTVVETTTPITVIQNSRQLATGRR